MTSNYKDGWIVALLAIMVPLIMMVLIIVPMYGSAVIGLYFVYGSVIFQHWDRYNMVVNAYSSLYQQWETVPALGFFDFFIPTFGCAIAGFIVTLLLIGLFISYIRSVFAP